MKAKPIIISAIHASAAVHAWYQAHLDALISGMAVSAQRIIVGAYRENFDPATMAHDAAPRNPALRMRTVFNQWGRKWSLKLDGLSVDLARKFASKNFRATQASMKNAFAESGFTVEFKPTPASVTAYHAVVTENVNLIKSIPAQYMKDIESNVWRSVMKGGDAHALSVDLQKTHGITQRRAATIARDQNNKAKAVIERARRQELGITHAIWMHSAGGKVPRKTHVAMDAKPYELAKGMYDSDEGTYVFPGELINCRCTSKAVLPFDSVEGQASKALTTQKASNLIALARQRAR